MSRPHWTAHCGDSLEVTLVHCVLPEMLSIVLLKVSHRGHCRSRATGTALALALSLKTHLVSRHCVGLSTNIIHWVEYCMHFFPLYRFAEASHYCCYCIQSHMEL